jgi:D-amino-acid oxidase
MMDRRSFLQNSSAFAGLSAMGLAGCARRVTAPSVAGAPSLPFYDAVGPIIPIRAHVDRIAGDGVVDPGLPDSVDLGGFA